MKTEKEEFPQLKISWAQFVEYAIEKIREEYPKAKSPTFMKTNGYESDGECYEKPEYVFINLK